MTFKRCFIGVVTLLIACHHFNVQCASIQTDDDLELLFRQRGHSDWKDVWHIETYSRCRERLVRHLYWACENDIYRLTRRNHKRADEEFNKHHIKSHQWQSIWLQPHPVQTMLRIRRTSSSSITTECCTKTGCTWEEYAEYCPSNKREDHQ